jgi:hypothetical protein
MDAGKASGNSGFTIDPQALALYSAFLKELKQYKSSEKLEQE